MAKRGRRPIPLVTRLIEGNRSQHALHLDATPTFPEEDNLVPPKSLGASGRTYWREVAPMLVDAGVMKKADRRALRGLCEWWEMWEVAMREARRGGPTAESTQGMGVNPALRAASAAWRHVESGMISFGLTPSARARLPVTGAKPNLDKLLNIEDETQKAEAA
jgi:P27 family predicted phage terminase small subunit